MLSAVTEKFLNICSMYISSYRSIYYTAIKFVSCESGFNIYTAVLLRKVMCKPFPPLAWHIEDTSNHDQSPT